MAQQFENIHEQFLKQKESIPPALRWKLEYMVDHIQGISKPIQQLSLQDQTQAKQIQQMNSDALKLVFISITKSIILPEFHEAVQKNCHIKTEGYFEKWAKAIIVIQSNHIYFKKKKQKLKFPTKGLQLKLKDEMKKIQLGYRGKKKATIKFSTKVGATTMMKKFQQIIQNFQSQYKKQMMNRIINMNSNAIEKQYVSFLMKKNTGIWIHKKQPKIHAQIIISCCHSDVIDLLEFFINQRSWNNNVKKQEVMKEKQKITVQRVFKPLSLFLTQRVTVTDIHIQVLDQKTFLLIQSNNRTQSNKIKAVLGSLQICLTCQLMQSNQIKLRIQSYFQSHGYCSEGDNKKMMMQMFKDLLHFQNSFNLPKNEKKNYVKNILQLKQNVKGKDETFKSIMVQNFDPFESQMTDNFETIRNEDENYDIFFGFENEEDHDQENEKVLKEEFIMFEKKKSKIESTIKKFKSLKPDKWQDEITSQYLKMLKNKVFEKTYQGFYFDQSNLQQYQSYDPWYCLPQLAKGGEYKITDEKQLFFINQDLIQGQKDTLKFVIKQIGANIISGKSVLNVSLPVDIFQSRSLLQRAASSYGCAPTFLRPVSDADPFTQMKNVLTFIASVPTLELIMQKPFNPILGQTFQGYLEGIPIYYEQISHHPPISSYYMKCEEYTMYGNLVAFANMGLNTGVGGNSGTMNILFKNGTHFECHFPPGQISGLIFGQRKFRSIGKGYVLEKKNKLFSQFSFEKESKGVYQNKNKEKMRPGDIIGGIFEVTEKFISDLSTISSMKKFSGIKKESIEKKLGQISGVWFQNILVNGELVNKNSKSYPIQYHKNVLPSDSNHRLDVMLHRIGDLKHSQVQKQVLEQIQRADRKLREKMNKSKK